VGIEVVAQVGSHVKAGDAILRVHHRGGRGLDDGLALLADAVVIGDEPLTPRPIVVERVSTGGRGK
jgi:pyrimidine-nucleoside phosphorylase/thymidine phosphorylase